MNEQVSVLQLLGSTVIAGHGHDMKLVGVMMFSSATFNCTGADADAEQAGSRY